jgi:hypothetical protein
MLNESYTLSVPVSESVGMNSLAFGGDIHLGIATPSTMTLPDAVTDIAQAITGDLTELKRKYSGLLIQLDGLRPDLTSADIYHRPSPEEWSILEILGHLIDTDREIWWPRIMTLLDNEGALSETRPYFINIDQDELIHRNGWQSLPLEDVLAQLMRIRWDYAMKMNGILDASFECTGIHATLGEISILRILQLLIAHDTYYLAKIRTLIEETA